MPDVAKYRVLDIVRISRTAAYCFAGDYAIHEIRLSNDGRFSYSLSALDEDSDGGGIYAESDVTSTGRREADYSRYRAVTHFRRGEEVLVSQDYADSRLAGREGILDATVQERVGYVFVDFPSPDIDELLEVRESALTATNRSIPVDPRGTPQAANQGEPDGSHHVEGSFVVVDSVEWHL